MALDLGKKIYHHQKKTKKKRTKKKKAKYLGGKYTSQTGGDVSNRINTHEKKCKTIDERIQKIKITGMQSEKWGGGRKTAILAASFSFLGPLGKHRSSPTIEIKFKKKNLFCNYSFLPNLTPLFDLLGPWGLARSWGKKKKKFIMFSKK